MRGGLSQRSDKMDKLLFFAVTVTLHGHSFIYIVALMQETSLVFVLQRITVCHFAKFAF